MKQLYAPVELTMVPEYLSSGFIGLTSSLEPDQDWQSKSYPDVFGIKEINKIKSKVYFEISCSDEMFEKFL